MRPTHNMLLAGVASFALLAGGGIAAAQQGPQGQTHASAGMSAQGAAQTPSGNKGGSPAAMELHAQTMSPSHGAASSPAKIGQPAMAQKSPELAKPRAKSEAKSESMKPENRSAQIKQREGRNAKLSARGSHEHLGESAKAKTKTRERVGATESTRRHHTRISQRNERKGEIKGLQANTSIPMQGSHVNLTAEQRNRVRDSVIDARGAPRVGHVNFDVTVGALVPRHRIHAVPVPETLVRIDPHWHGYLYFIVENQVVIVDPRDMRIVAVLDV